MTIFGLSVRFLLGWPPAQFLSCLLVRNADPDQNLVELQVDNFGNWDASAEWMRTSEDFRQNPVGAFFDPDRVLAAHKAGATFPGQFLHSSPAHIYQRILLLRGMKPFQILRVLAPSALYRSVIGRLVG